MRISTQAAAHTALLDLMRAQRELYQSSQQVATGLKAPDLKGYGNQAETILFGRAALSRAENFVEASKRLENRLGVQDLALGELSGAVQDLRVALTTNDGSYLMNDVQAAFERARNALNTQFAGSFIFGGTRTDQEPFTASTIGQLQGAADIGDFFRNASQKQTGRIDEKTAVEISFLADDLAQELMEIFARIADFDQGPDGPFGGTVTQQQQGFLSAEIANVIGVFERINDAVGINGSLQARLESSVRSNQQRADYLKAMIADYEEADMAAAATRLAQAQTAVQVSALVFADMSQVSLLPFLR